jgi:hypothetical protein
MLFFFTFIFEAIAVLVQVPVGRLVGFFFSYEYFILFSPIYKSAVDGLAVKSLQVTSESRHEHVFLIFVSVCTAYVISRDFVAARPPTTADRDNTMKRWNDGSQ